MVQRGSPFRLLVTVLLAVAVPFCCCDFQALISGCASCEAPARQMDAEAVAHVHDDGAAHHHAAHHEHAANHGTDTNGDHGTTPCGPGDEEHDCNCGKTEGKMLTVQKSTLELPAPVVVAVLDWAQPADQVSLALFWGHDRDLRVVQRPQTTLLRLHCALIV